MLYLEASTVKTTLGCPGCRVGHVTGLCYVGLCLFGFCPLLSLSWCRLCVVFRLAAPWLVRACAVGSLALGVFPVDVTVA